MGNENILKQTGVTVAPLVEYIFKKHQIIYFKWVNCMVCELYLSKLFVVKIQDFKKIVSTLLLAIL